MCDSESSLCLCRDLLVSLLTQPRLKMSNVLRTSSLLFGSDPSKVKGEDEGQMDWKKGGGEEGTGGGGDKHLTPALSGINRV